MNGQLTAVVAATWRRCPRFHRFDVTKPGNFTFVRAPQWPFPVVPFAYAERPAQYARTFSIVDQRVRPFYYLWALPGAKAPCCGCRSWLGDAVFAACSVV